MIDEKRVLEELADFKRCQKSENCDYLTGYISALSAVEVMIAEQPKAGEWISVSERLPESEDKYAWFKCNVTIMRSHWPTSSYDYCDSPYDEYFVTEAMYDTCQKIWHIGDTQCLNALIDIEDSPLNGDYVIAWQDLPEPYKEEVNQ